MRRLKQSLSGFTASFCILALVVLQIAIIPPASAVLMEGSDYTDYTYFYQNRNAACSIWSSPSAEGTMSNMYEAIQMAEAGGMQGVLRWDRTLDCAVRTDSLLREVYCEWMFGDEEGVLGPWHCMWRITYDIHMGGL